MNFILLLLSLSLFILCTSQTTPAIFNGDEWIQIEEDSQNNIATPSPHTYANQNKTSKIFVAIVSFRDIRCSVTLKNLFSKAKHPDRVHVGIVEQIHTEEDNSDCIAAYCNLMASQGGQHPGGGCPHKNQINKVVLSFLDSRGPAFARSLQTQMLADEEFCMQVDSHVDVVQDWDVEMINMWAATGNEYGVLSTVPPPLDALGKNVRDHFEVPHICQATFTDSGMVRHLEPRAAMQLSRPLLAPFWSAGYSFSKCHAEIKTPYDPNYLFIFDGEEFAKYARLWTRGYDVYTPSRNLVAHDTTGVLKVGAPQAVSAQADPLEWSRNGMKDTYRWEMFTNSLHRIKTLLGMPEGDKDVGHIATLLNYGLGLKRTLDQFILFTGIDTRTLTVFGDRCVQLKWVPFTPDKDPNLDSSDVWGYGPDKLVKNGGNIPLLSGSIEYVSFDASSAAFRSATGGEDPKASSSGGSGELSEDALKKGHFLGSTDRGKAVLEEAEVEVKRSIEKAKGELWWIFQSVDRSVEAVILQVDNEVGSGHGHRVLKLILLLAPLFLLVLYTAIRVMASTGRPMRGDAKRI